MIKATRVLMLMALVACFCGAAIAQTSGSISGEVRDEKQAVITGATVTMRNISTNETRTVQTNADGRYHFAGVPVGSYEITVESSGFAKHQQSGITLALNQSAVVDVTMKPGAVQEVVNVVENASMLNTSTAEVGTRFDEKRLSELPLATTRSVYNIALSAPGVSQLNVRTERVRRRRSRSKLFLQRRPDSFEQLHDRWSGQQQLRCRRLDDSVEQS